MARALEVKIAYCWRRHIPKQILQFQVAVMWSRIKLRRS